MTLAERSGNDWTAVYLHELDAGGTPAAAVTQVSMMAYFGSFAGPILIGLLATEAGLGIALLVPVVALVLAAAGASVTTGGEPVRALSVVGSSRCRT